MHFRGLANETSRYRDWPELAGIFAGLPGPTVWISATRRSTKRRWPWQGLSIDQASQLPRVEATPPSLSEAAKTAVILPKWLLDGPAWGITGQLYELRSARSCGNRRFRRSRNALPDCGAAGRGTSSG